MIATNRKKNSYHFVIILIFTAFIVLSFAHTACAQNWTGDGGKGMSITILTPQAAGLAENQSHLPALIQGEFISNFSNYSAIDVLDWQRREAIIVHIMSSPSYSDSVQEQTRQEIGNLIPTTHFMDGKLLKTPTGYNLQISIIRNSDKMTTASYSGNFTFWELNNLTGIRRASLELLPKMGVTLTAKAQQELAGAAIENYVNAQAALARGITAQRQGTEVAALSYYFQAAAFDPTMMEAVNRSSILNANITSGNMGDNIRNDIVWRRQWIERLEETEKFFDNFNKTESMPYTLFYTNDIKQVGAINYQHETVNMSIETYLYSKSSWTNSIERALQTVWDGLDATGRKDTWELGRWPHSSVTNLNAFARRSKSFSVVFQLYNDQNKLLSSQTLQAGGYWGLSNSGRRPTFYISSPDRKTIIFRNVNANYITDNLIIRVASVNGKDAETAAIDGVLQIQAITSNEVFMNDRFKFAKGEIQGFTNHRDNETELVIPGNIWGDPVISIGANAFSNILLTSLTISDNVRSIDREAFWGNNLRSITIGANVDMNPNSFTNSRFRNFYYPGRRADTYTVNLGRWLSEEQLKIEQMERIERQKRLEAESEESLYNYRRREEIQAKEQITTWEEPTEKRLKIGWRIGFGPSWTFAGSSSEWFDMMCRECEAIGDSKNSQTATFSFDIGLKLNIRATDMMTFATELNYNRLRNKIRYENYNFFIDNNTMTVPALLRYGGKTHGWYLESGFQWGFPIYSSANVKGNHSELDREQDHGIVYGFGKNGTGLRFLHHLTKWDKNGTLKAPFIISFYLGYDF